MIFRQDEALSQDLHLQQTPQLRLPSNAVVSNLAHGNDRARQYFTRTVSGRKSKAQALVRLRGQMVNIVSMTMKHRTEYRYP
jgi:hypothetical protein